MECIIYQSVRRAKLNKREIKKIVFFIFKKLNFSEAEVSVQLIGERRMRTLNYLYRGKDMATDVMAFAQQGQGGDIFLCLPRIKKQARDFRINYQEELARMLAHGILHLVGYDHQTAKASRRMFFIQEKLVRQCYEAKVINRKF